VSSFGSAALFAEKLCFSEVRHFSRGFAAGGEAAKTSSPRRKSGAFP